MKKILLFLLIANSLFAQLDIRTYRTLTEACTQNQPGTGYTPQNFKFYVQKGGLIVGKTVWSSSSPTSKIKLRPGNYYVVQGNQAMKIDQLGRVANIISCESGPVNPTESQSYLISQVPNQINWSQFGNFQNTFGQAVYGYGNPRFSNETGPSGDALAHGWTHTDGVGLNTIAQVPINKASKFMDCNAVFDNQIVPELIAAGKADAAGMSTKTENLTSVSDATAFEAGKKLYYSSWGAWVPETNSYGVRIGVPFWNEEMWQGRWEEKGRLMKQIILGAKDRATAEGKFFEPILYGYLFNSCLGSFTLNNASIPFGEKRFFPYHSSAEIATFKNASVNVTPYLGIAGIQHGLFSYEKVPFPMYESLYKKDSDGKYVMSGGRRVWRDTDFTEKQNGQTINFYASPKDAREYYYENDYLPEVWYATIQPYALYSHLVFARMGLKKFNNGNYDISTPDNFTNKLCHIIRDETEGTFFSMTKISRPISQYMAEFQVYLTYLIGVKSMYVWTDYGPRAGLNEPGGYPVKPYGQDYNLFKDGQIQPVPRYWGTFESYTASLKYLQDIHNKYNVFSGSEKYWQATAPSDQTNQVLLFGVLSGKNLVVFGTDPRLDKDEEIVVNMSLSNQSGFNKTFKIKGRQHFVNAFELPAGTYTTDNIRLQYNDLYGVQHKHTGNLLNPNW
ncbi:hypothetical protein [Emticicia fontis]